MKESEETFVRCEAFIFEMPVYSECLSFEWILWISFSSLFYRCPSHKMVKEAMKRKHFDWMLPKYTLFTDTKKKLIAHDKSHWSIQSMKIDSSHFFFQNRFDANSAIMWLLHFSESSILPLPKFNRSFTNHWKKKVVVWTKKSNRERMKSMEKLDMRFSIKKLFVHSARGQYFYGIDTSARLFFETNTPNDNRINSE